MRYRARFLTPLVATPLSDGKNWRLAKALRFEDTHGAVHCVPCGFVTDYASMPSLNKIGAVMALGGFGLSYAPSIYLDAMAGILVALGAWLAWLTDDFMDDDRLDAPAVLHDNGYRRERLGRRTCLKSYWDWLFLVALEANGVGVAKRYTIWLMVTLFGWGAWFKDGNR